MFHYFAVTYFGTCYWHLRKHTRNRFVRYLKFSEMFNVESWELYGNYRFVRSIRRPKPTDKIWYKWPWNVNQLRIVASYKQDLI